MSISSLSVRKSLYLLLSIFFFACNGETRNPTQFQSPDPDPVPDNTTPFNGGGFGVSGLLFENNLIMWYRDSDGNQSDLFPQMYFTRMDAPDYPVWDSFPEQHILSGGVPRDGIPSLMVPPFVAVDAAQATYVNENDLVLGAVVNGEVKAYPKKILWWHEIANDVIGEQSVTMTLCPLTGTGMLFKVPEIGNAIETLELLPVVETTWAAWKAMYPQTRVISINTGFDRNYQLYPYGSYRQEETSPLFPLRTILTLDARYPPKHTVLGIAEGDAQKAYPFSELEGNPVVNDELDGVQILIVSDIASRLAIPYYRTLDDRVLTFSLVSTEPFEMRDDETGSLWNIKGQAVSGELEGARLVQKPAYNAFWFAWIVFWPQTSIFQGGA